VNLYTGLVAITFQGEYLIDSTRGSVNVKGRKIVDGQITDLNYVIPRTSIKDTRPLAPLETATAESDVKVRTGSVVRFKKAMKNHTADTLFVVFKMSGDGSFNVIELGGNSKSRYFRGIRPNSVEVMDPAKVTVV
jgi:hypothetical protein